MTKRLLVPALLLAACAHDTEPDEQQVSTETEDGGTDGAPDADNPLRALFLSDPHECTDNSARFMGHVAYLDGTIVENPICRYEFEDGTVVDSCFAVHSLPTLQRVVFTATDPETGATASDEDFIKGPDSWSATADVSSDGLTISWDVHTLYGTAADVGGVQITFDPSDKVIIDDPAVTRQFSGTVRVTEAGTYTVHVNAFITFGEEGGCGVFLDRTIAVTCTDATHTH